MSRSSPEPVANAGDAPPEGAGDKPLVSRSGFGSLGRRIAGRTTDLIAIAVVLIAGISMGGTVIRWWNTDPNSESTGAFANSHPQIVPDWQAEGQSVSIGLGNHPVTIERQQLSGDAEQVKAALLASFKQRVQAAERPRTAAAESELQMLTYLKTSLPVETAEDGTRIDHFDGPLNLYVGSRTAADDTDRRIVGWGLAFPAGENLWTAYFFAPDETRRSKPVLDWNSLLPGAARRTLSLATPDGATLLAFEGNAAAADWEAEITRQCEKSGLRPIDDWNRTGRGSRAIFAREQDSARLHVEITLSFSTDSNVAGILHATVARHTGEGL